MSGLRLALVTRRYWPHCGEDERQLSQFARELRRQGAAPTVLTQQWEASWPREVWLNEIRVVRFPRRGWSWGADYACLRSMARWLQTRADAFQVVCLWGFPADGLSALRAFRGQALPLVCHLADREGTRQERPRGGLHAGPANGHAAEVPARQRGLLRGASRRWSRREPYADAFVVRRPAIRRELIELQCAPERIHVIRPGTAEWQQASKQQKREARRVLADCNLDLTVRDAAPIALRVGALRDVTPLVRLLRAFRQVVEHLPEARLWLIGDGPAREKLYREICDWDLRDNVQMPGSFDQTDTVLRAADVYVCPCREDGMTGSTLEACMFGLPVVAWDTPDMRTWIEHERQGLLVSDADSSSWAQALQRLLADRALARRLGRGARDIATRSSIRARVHDHLLLFHQLARQKQP